MMPPARIALALVALAGTAPALAGRGPSKAAAWPPAFDFVEVAPGVWTAVEPSNPTPIVHGNTTFIINRDDVVAMDANATGSAARATIALLRKKTSKPVRQLVISHWHYDHIMGIQAFRSAFPGLEVISHPSVREHMERCLIPGQASRLARAAAGLRRTDSLIGAGVGLDRAPLDSANRAFMVLYRGLQKYRLDDLERLEYVLPTTTFSDSLTLHKAGREIRVLHLGRGNSPGDAILWLPAERVVVMGDVLVHPIPYPFGVYPSEWVAVLRAIKALDPLVVVPGHGAVQRDTKYLELVADWLAAVVEEVRKGVARGLDEETLKKEIVLDEFRGRFTHGDPDLESLWRQVMPFAISSAYLEVKGQLPARDDC